MSASPAPLPVRQPGPRHVVVATDENFAMPTAVTLRSLVANGGGPFAISVLHDGLTTDSRDRITASIAGLPDTPGGGGTTTLDWFDVSDFHVGATTASHLPDSTYFRLRLADALPATARRAMYLDVDVLVRRDLTPMFEADLGGAVLGAVRSVHFPHIGTRGAVPDWRVLGLDPHAPFFNAGVLSVDVERWRGDGVAESTLAYLRSPHCGRGADQQALNAVLGGRWTPFAPTWNQQTPLLDDAHGAHLIHDAAEIEAARVDPHIVHFQTRPKPWQRGTTHPWGAAWRAVADETAFEVVADLRERSTADEVRWRARRAASALVKGR